MLTMILASPLFISIWLTMVALSLVWLIRDLRRNNPEIPGLM